MSGLSIVLLLLTNYHGESLNVEETEHVCLVEITSLILHLHFALLYLSKEITIVVKVKTLI